MNSATAERTAARRSARRSAAIVPLEQLWGQLPEGRQRELLRELTRILGHGERIAAEDLTVITNLHTLDTARNYCERIIGMARGRVVFDGTPAELTARFAVT